MSRRLVSYSDLTDDAPLVGEAGPSSHPLQGGGNASGKRKRNAADTHTRRMRGVRRGVVHWDDPDYVSEPSAVLEDGVGGYREEVLARGDVDEAVEGEGNELWEEAGVGADRRSFNGVEQSYTDWKYDEWGEPYGADRVCDLEDEPQYPEEDHDNDEEYEDDSSDHSQLLPFAIPDVTEYHRLHPSLPSLSSSTPPPHRPPHAVGGGGRILTHAEIWSPTSLINAFNAALSQYCHLHNLPSLSPAVESALWTEAPAHESLLATQVREDGRQILAQRRTQPSKTQIGHDGIVEVASEGCGKNRKKKGKGEPPQQQQQKRKVVTVVPHAEVEGNSAWKKAVKTVQATPNQIGLDKSLLEGDGHQGSVDRADTVDTVDQLDTVEQADKADEVDKVDALEGGEGEHRQKELHAWWYAGYQAGMAAVSEGRPALPDGGAGEKAVDNDVAPAAEADDIIAPPST